MVVQDCGEWTFPIWLEQLSPKNNALILEVDNFWFVGGFRRLRSIYAYQASHGYDKEDCSHG
jgi:hypothetical protein